MDKVFYNHLLQFLVALAIGTLTGDALLHLLPHAISPGGHDESEEEGHGHDLDPIWKGAVILVGIYTFFMVERIMAMITQWKRQKHGRSQHGHSHEVPGDVSSVAWMVIMGDGLHNFTDGLAIGAAFADNLSVGLSTTLAVFCHELPHELGDFAVLLRAGMKVKQALVYNVLSSVLCVIGMVGGLLLGNLESAHGWIYALTAGIFIYISLVDMLPEITSTKTKKGESPCCHLLLQMLGISLGVAIMLIIAIYEDRIMISIDG
ncbi:hypothetical protein CAPTEDRAFT_18141 [Capitella teleta]|uniref:Zinc transporter ZIP4 N-terminal domain-containing protein n=1 Tax=Capitella teleta TaxID=283909 RepID=R7TAK4_CAPTE|nr:hypothetical protein CAPTEDRAFT_18141 [Capitella teleta]|eukprot:ELT90758.1 hypothetical protein CAPTEDRAFT_18141 [Capitella teleta]